MLLDSGNSSQADETVVNRCIPRQLHIRQFHQHQDMLNHKREECIRCSQEPVPVTEYQAHNLREAMEIWLLHKLPYPTHESNNVFNHSKPTMTVIPMAVQ